MAVMPEVITSADSAISALLALGAASPSAIGLHLLLADRCNHACGHCYQVQGLKGELSTEQIRSLLREFRAGGGFLVTFSGGEATLRHDLISLLADAHELGLATVLYTNGFTMDDALSSAIAACHVWRVEISLYSHRAEEHDAVTGIAGSWEKTVQGVVRLRARRVNVILKFTPTAQSTSTSTDLSALANRLDAHLFVAELLNAGEAGRLEPTAVRRVPAQAIHSDLARSSREADPIDGRPCNAGAQLTIRSDGQLQPCSQLQVSMGQFGASTLAEASSSDVARFFREVTWRDFPACRECELRTHCRRCYASAVAEVGDMLAPYRGACELAVARYREQSGYAGPIVIGDQEGSDRDTAVGPYRIERGAALRTAKAQHLAYDEALADRYPWLRQSREALRASACSTSPANMEHRLFQLRRPNQTERR